MSRKNKGEVIHTRRRVEPQIKSPHGKWLNPPHIGHFEKCFHWLQGSCTKLNKNLCNKYTMLSLHAAYIESKVADYK